MKVILSQRLPNLGEMGETVKVKDGYARNYLIPRKLAVSLTSASARQIEHERHMIARREEKVRAQLQEVSKKMEELTVEIKARAGEEEKLFGSVTSAHIAEHLKALGYETDRKSILLEEPIKSLGIYTVPVKLGSGIEANVKVWVTSDKPIEVAEDEPAVEAKAEEAKTGETASTDEVSQETSA